MSFWKYCGWSFEFESKVESKTPDFKVKIDNDNCFIAEVTTLGSNYPQLETITRIENGNIISIDKQTGKKLEKLPIAVPIEQYKKIIYEVDQKYNRYQSIIKKHNVPFVMCFYIPDFKTKSYFSNSQIETALFGEQTIVIMKNKAEDLEYTLSPNKFKNEYGKDNYTGIFCFEEYSNITAILFIDNEFINNKNCFCVKIYLNPLGYWKNINYDPFTKKGLLVNYVDENGYIQLKKLNIF